MILLHRVTHCCQYLRGTGGRYGRNELLCVLIWRDSGAPKCLAPRFANLFGCIASGNSVHRSSLALPVKLLSYARSLSLEPCKVAQCCQYESAIDRRTARYGGLTKAFPSIALC